MASLVSDHFSAGVLTRRGASALAVGRRFGGLLPAITAAAAVGLIPLWWHLTIVDSGTQGIISVFTEVGVYPTDLCVGMLALAVVVRPGALDAASRWVAAGLAGLAAAALVSARWAIDPTLAYAVAGQLAALGLAWLGLRAMHVPRAAIVAALVGSAVVESGLAAAQFVWQQPLVPPELALPWLPTDAAGGGAPVILSPTGDRLLRGFGTFPHPNILGGYLAFALVCLPVLAERWPHKAALWWMAGALIMVGLLASFSRGAWLAVTVAFCVRSCIGALQGRARWWLAPMLVVATAVVLLASPLRTTVEERLLPYAAVANSLERGSIEHRLELDRAALEEIQANWPDGTGAANYGVAAIAEGHQQGDWGEPAPNIGLLTIAELGMPGAIALSCIAFGILRVLRTGNALDVTGVAAFAALVVLSMVDHFLWSMPLGRAMGWIPFALIAATPPTRISRRRAARSYATTA
jgi:O-Antigen ligase